MAHLPKNGISITRTPSALVMRIPSETRLAASRLLLLRQSACSRSRQVPSSGIFSFFDSSRYRAISSASSMVILFVGEGAADAHLHTVEAQLLGQRDGFDLARQPQIPIGDTDLDALWRRQTSVRSPGRRAAPANKVLREIMSVSYSRSRGSSSRAVRKT